MNMGIMMIMMAYGDHLFLPYSVKTMGSFKEPFQSTLFSVSSHHPFKIPDGKIEMHTDVSFQFEVLLIDLQQLIIALKGKLFLKPKRRVMLAFWVGVASKTIY